jgi:pyruvate dehydrogenase E2 component (dihydrolipoamide acetyltransferase)
MHSDEVTALGRTIRFTGGGEGEREVLFVHGFGADRSTWIFTLPAVAGVARVVALDLPGHGRSSPDVGAGDVPFLADLVCAFMDETGLASPHFIGHSLGAAIGLEIATRRPGRVAALSLIAPAGLGATINRAFIDGFPRLSDADATAKMLELLVARPQMISPQMVADVLGYLARPGVRDALMQIAGAAFPDGRQGWRYEDRVEELGIPVEIVWGREDRVLSPWLASPPGIPVEVVPGAGHLVHMEMPQRINRRLVAAVERDRGDRTVH